MAATSCAAAAISGGGGALRLHRRGSTNPRAIANAHSTSTRRARRPFLPPVRRLSTTTLAAAASEFPKDSGTEGGKTDSKGKGEQADPQASAGGDVKDVEEEPKGWWGRTKAWFKSPKGLSKEKLLKMGTSALLSYGFVSNINAITLMIIAWNMFTAKTGLSPFAAGQWAPYLLTYAALYATFGNLLRPFRLMLAAALSPVFDKIVKKIGTTFNVKPPIAMGLTVFFVNFCGTLSYLALGLFLTSLFTGMPILPA